MKNIKFSGLESWQLVNTDTGEVKPPEDIIEFVDGNGGQLPVEAKRANFAILYPLKFYGLVNAVGSKKMEVISYIVKHMGADNVLIATEKEIAQNAKVGKRTVERTLKALANANLIHRRPGVIMLNPLLMNRKHRSGEYRLMLKYEDIGGNNDDGRIHDSQPDPPPQEQDQKPLAPPR